MARNLREVEIITRALELAEQRGMHAGVALLQALSDLGASDAERKAAQATYAEALMTMPIGHGLDYDKELLRQALRSLDGDLPPTGKKQRKKKERKMTENSNTNDTTNTEATDNVQSIATAKKSKTGRTRKYNIGDRYNLTGAFGLQPIESKDGLAPSIEFQLSYKEKKCQERGFSVVPAGTEVIYLGCRNVFGDAGKKMVFKVIAGTALVGGGTLDRDVEAAGVVSHIVETTRKAKIEEAAPLAADAVVA